MGSKRDNLAFDEDRFHRRTHYHGKSYHKHLEHIDPGFSNWNQPCTFTFFVNVGQRCTIAESRCDHPGAKINWFERCCHTQSVGCLSKRDVANASYVDFVACACQINARLARTSLRRVSACQHRRNCFLAPNAQTLSWEALSSGSKSSIACCHLWHRRRSGRNQWTKTGPATRF